MPIWKKNLIVCWFGVFVTSVGLSQIAPILPLYIRQLGVTSTSSVAQLSGFTYGATYIILAVFSPVWGHAADRFGRKPMLLRASFGMAAVIFGMGLVPNIYALIALRLLQGTVAGYTTACTTLLATQVDQEHAGYALGALSTAEIAGSLFGPLLAGSIDEALGIRPVFFLTSVFLMIAFFTTLFFVKENFVREEQKAASVRDVWSSLPEKGLTSALFVAFFAINLGLFTIEPIVTEYVKLLTNDSSHVALISGCVFSVSGVSSVLAAPQLGKLSDKIGAHKIILISLIAAGLFFIPQAFVKNPWQLLALRFLLGFTIAGLNPSVSTLIKKITPPRLTGRVFGIIMSAAYLGAFGGSVAGGQIAAAYGIPTVFVLTSSVMLLCAVLVYFQIFKKIQKQIAVSRKEDQTASFFP